MLFVHRAIAKSKMYFQKKKKQKWNSKGIGGFMHFGISEGKGGLKHGSRPWLGMDIFWNCPMKPLFQWKIQMGALQKLQTP